jgi:hypothetical protein
MAAIPDNVLAVNFKIKKQFPRSAYGQLMFAVLQLAIIDAFTPRKDNEAKSKNSCRNADENRASALQYLKSEMPHCSVCDINSSWVRRVISDAGLKL